MYLVTLRHYFFSYEESIAIIGRILAWYAKLFEGRDYHHVANSKLISRLVSLTELVYANVDRNQLKSVGVKPDGMILDCTYKGKNCSVEKFKHYLHPTFLNCYTFHPDETSKSSEILTGPQHGLSLILRSEASPLPGYDKVDLSGNTDSIRVAIHPPNTVPFLRNEGIDLEPGKSTSLSLMMKSYERLGSPYAPCKDKEELTINGRGFESTSNVCREKCIAETLQKRCNCTSTMFEDLIPHNNYQYCLNIGVNDNFDTVNNRSTCEVDFINNLPDLNCGHCIWDCNEIEYDTQIAFADWPHAIRATTLIDLFSTPQACTHPIKRYYSTLVHNSQVDPEDVVYQNELCPLPVNNDTKMPFSLISVANVVQTPEDMLIFARPDFAEVYKYQMDLPWWYKEIDELEQLKLRWVKDSFYRLNVYFKKSTVEQHIQVASFSLADLWSGVGGILGLWLGISVMTIIEVFSFVFYSITNCFKGKNKTNTVAATQQEDDAPQCAPTSEKYDLPKVSK